MKPQNHQEYTFLQEPASPSLQEQVVAHLGTTGQRPTTDPEVFQTSPMPGKISASTDITDLNKSLPMHSHTFMELFYYKSGNNVGFLIDSHRYVLQKGDIVIIPPGVWHCTLRTSQSTEPCSRYQIILNQAYLKELGSVDPEQIAPHMELPYILRTAGTSLEYMERIFSLCCKEGQEKSPYWQEVLDACVRLIFAQILRANKNRTSPAINAQNDGIFEKSISYVDTHLTQKLTLSETAQTLFTSERTITREFQKNMGLSFYRYVTLRRLELSKQLIENGTPLEDVSQAVGFFDYPTFYRAFKKHFGCSPRQMRQEMEQQKQETAS